MPKPNLTPDLQSVSQSSHNKTSLAAGGLYRLRPEGTSQPFEIRQPDDNSALKAGITRSKAAKQLLDLQDQLYDIVAANHFYYEAVESIAARYNDSIDSRTLHGWGTTSAWLETSQQTILQKLENIRLCLVESDRAAEAEDSGT